MGTQWTAMTRMYPNEWLLANGDVVREPALEMTSTGRKVRVAGTTNSVFHNDLDTLLNRAVQEVAEAKSTKVWLNLTGGLDHMLTSSMGFNPHQMKAALHVINDTSFTLAWWRFKDPTTPFEVYVVAKLTNQRGTSKPQTLQHHLYMPIDNHRYNGGTEALGVTDAQFSAAVSRVDYHHESEWVDFLKAHPIEALSDLGVGQFGNARTGVKALLEVVRKIEDLDEIEVPDFGDPAVPKVRTLELYQTNVNADFISTLTEYLDGTPTIEKAVGLYEELIQALRGAGITVDSLKDNEFMTALLQGDRESLSVRIHNVAEYGFKDDQNHKLSMHLPTGTFVVECTHQGVDKNVVAEKWEEAVTMASLTGQEDELLAYAREFAKGANQRRTEDILKQRRS